MRAALTTISPPAHHDRERARLVPSFEKGEAMTPRLYIGTVGLSVWYSDDPGGAKDAAQP